MAKKSKKQIKRDEMLYELTTLVAGAFSLQEVLDKLAEAAVKIIGVTGCSIRLLDDEAGELQMRSTYGLSEEYRNKGPVTKDDAVIGQAFSGEAVVLDDMRIDGRVKYKDATVKEGLISQLTVAMKFREKPVGVLRMYSPTPRHFNDDAIGLARTVASQCAVAITNARLYGEAINGEKIAEQMRLAGVIQRRMIPEKALSMPGFDIKADYIPCFDVGGDFYDFLQLSESKFLVVIADVIGKGIPAALMMALFRGAVRAFADRQCCSENMLDIINRLNRMAYRECRDGEFISMFYCIIDAEEKSITYCSCGHEPTILIRGGKSEDLMVGGLVLGVVEDAKYEIETVKLKKDDVLIFYTDGLIDASNFDGALWGRENLIQTALKYADNEADSFIANIVRYRRRFVGLASQTDDTSIIVVKVKD